MRYHLFVCGSLPQCITDSPLLGHNDDLGHNDGHNDDCANDAQSDKVENKNKISDKDNHIDTDNSAKDNDTRTNNNSDCGEDVVSDVSTTIFPLMRPVDVTSIVGTKADADTRETIGDTTILAMSSGERESEIDPWRYCNRSPARKE